MSRVLALGIGLLVVAALNSIALADGISRARFGPEISRVVVTPSTATVLDISAPSTGATTPAERERIASTARDR